MSNKRRKIIIAVLLIIIIVLLMNIIYYLIKPNEVEVDKPNIYLYPKTEQNIAVRLDTKGVITTSIPEYNDGWNVRVKSNGSISGGHKFLFYEAEVKDTFELNRGWIVRQDDFNNKMEGILNQIGLNNNEEKDFMGYWSKKLDWGNKRYAVYYIPQNDIDNSVKLNVSGNPESVLRVWFYFVPLNEDKKLDTPVIHHFERKGYTVVEWGGIVE